MTRAEIDKNNCLVIYEDQFRNYHLHPLWLRERLTAPEFLDTNNYQRLYEPSLIAQNITIKNFSLDKDLKESNYDSVTTTLIVNNFVTSFNQLTLRDSF